MSVSDFAMLFIIGFIIGLFGRLIYARLTGRLDPANLRNENNVRYIDTARDSTIKTATETTLNQNAETDAPDEQEQQQPEKKAANQ